MPGAGESGPVRLHEQPAPVRPARQDLSPSLSRERAGVRPGNGTGPHPEAGEAMNAREVRERLRPPPGMAAKRTRFKCPVCGKEVLHIDQDVYFCSDERDCGYFVFASKAAAK